MNWSALIQEHGSLRRLLEKYWTGALDHETERFIETHMQPQTIIGYKPLCK